MKRRDFCKNGVAGTLVNPLSTLLGASNFSATSQAAGAAKPNVIFISIDDLNDASRAFEGGFLSVETPAIEALAKQGLTFQRAYCAAPACGPSRTATLSGVHPKNFSDAGWAHFSTYVGGVQVLPQILRNSGYRTAAFGKVFHGDFKYAPGVTEAPYTDVNFSQGLWDEYLAMPSNFVPPDFVDKMMFRPYYDGQEDIIPDNKVVARTKEFLSKPQDKPFFLAVGLYRPHLPWLVPKRYFEKHPLESISVPNIPTGEFLDLPESAKMMAGPNGDHRSVIDSNQWKQTIQGYLASVSFADDCLGQIMQALNASPFAKNTIVVLWSDHGWHLGEKLGWRKFKLWERATRIPMIIAHPTGAKGESRYSPVSLMDMVPTITELCLGTASKSQYGQSLSKIVMGAQEPQDRKIVTSWYVNGHNITVRDRRWRYIAYTDGTEELYDHFNDPGEHVNLLKLNSQDVSFKAIIDQLRSAL